MTFAVFVLFRLKPLTDYTRNCSRNANLKSAISPSHEWCVAFVFLIFLFCHALVKDFDECLAHNQFHYFKK